MLKNDYVLYFNFYVFFERYSVGEIREILIFIEYGVFFVREGVVILIGKLKVMVIVFFGELRIYIDGVDVIVESEGG